MDDIYYLSSTAVSRCLESIDAVQVVREAHILHALGETELPAESHLQWTAPSGLPARSLGMAGGILGDQLALGMKIINSSLSNVSNGLPRASGITALFDPETGRVSTIMEGAAISSIRTAATSILAFSALANSNAATLSIIGSGPLGAAHIDQALQSLPGLLAIRLFDRVPSRAAQLGELWAQRCESAGVDMQVSRNLESTVRAADCLVTATTATEPYIDASWLERPILISNVSLDDLPAATYLGAQFLLVDDWSLIKADRHRLLGRLHRSGQIGGIGDPIGGFPRMVDAELGDFLLQQSEPARVIAKAEVSGPVIFNPFGMAISDIALASSVARLATSLSLGQQLVP